MQGPGADVEMGQDVEGFVPQIVQMADLLLESSTATWLGFVPVGRGAGALQGIRSHSYAPRPAASRLPCPQVLSLAPCMVAFNEMLIYGINS